MARSRRAHDRDVDAAVQRTDPLLGWRLNDDALTSSLEEAGALIFQHASPARGIRRRRTLRTPRRIAVFAVMVLGVSGAAAAAAGVFVNASTHRHLHGWELRESGPGELLNTSGTNYIQVVLHESASISYPASYAAWRDFAAEASRPVKKCPGKGTAPSCTIELTTGQVTADIATSAFAAWVLAWRKAELDGNRTAAQDAATSVAALQRKAATSLDDESSGYGSFRWMTPLVHAVKAGSVKVVDRLIATHENFGLLFWLADPKVSARYQHREYPSNPGAAYVRYLETGRL